MLVGNDPDTGADQRIVADIDSTRAIDDRKVIDFDTVAESNTLAPSLYIGAAIEGDLITKNDAFAMCGIYQ